MSPLRRHGHPIYCDLSLRDIPRFDRNNMRLPFRELRRGPVLATGVLHGLPLFECGFDRQKIFMFAVVGMLLDGSASPSKSSTACRANGIFRENLSQCVRELKIKCRNVGPANHAITPTPENVRGAVRPFACGLATTHTSNMMKFAPSQCFYEARDTTSYQLR